MHIQHTAQHTQHALENLPHNFYTQHTTHDALPDLLGLYGINPLDAGNPQERCHLDTQSTLTLHTRT